MAEHTPSRMNTALASLPIPCETLQPRDTPTHPGLGFALISILCQVMSQIHGLGDPWELKGLGFSFIGPQALPQPQDPSMEGPPDPGCLPQGRAQGYRSPQRLCQVRVSEPHAAPSSPLDLEQLRRSTLGLKGSQL